MSRPTGSMRLRHLIRQAVEQKAFPAAVIEVGDPTRVLWRHAFGHLYAGSDAPETLDDTVFDLASLTKVLATTAIAMQQVERGGLGLDDPVGHHISAWTGADRLSVTVRDLLAHCGGLTAHIPFFRTLKGGTAFEQAICQSALGVRASVSVRLQRSRFHASRFHSWSGGSN